MSVHTISGADLGVQVFLGKREPRADRLIPVTPSQGMFGSVKPMGGMWTSSPSAHISGWAEWCRGEQFSDNAQQMWELVPSAEVELAEIDSLDDLKALHLLYGRSEELVTYRHHWLDYSLIAERYAGIHLTDNGQWATRLTQPYNLYGWDCESTLWFRWSFGEVRHVGTVHVHEPSTMSDVSE